MSWAVGQYHRAADVQAVTREAGFVVLAVPNYNPN